jgi:hypothetical protein
MEAMMRVIATTLLLLGLAGAPRIAVAEDMNACGCYHDETGACKCTNKKAKCACPGDCEPVSCEARREKEAARQADAALKKIEAREKKKAADATRAAKTGTKPKAPKQEPPAPPKDSLDQLLQKR